MPLGESSSKCWAAGIRGTGSNARLRLRERHFWLATRQEEYAALLFLIAASALGSKTPQLKVVALWRNAATHNPWAVTIETPSRPQCVLQASSGKKRMEKTPLASLNSSAWAAATGELEDTTALSSSTVGVLMRVIRYVHLQKRDIPDDDAPDAPDVFLALLLLRSWPCLQMSLFWVGLCSTVAARRS